LKGSILSRFGFRTVTTGNLAIRLNTVFQSQIFMDKKFKKRSQNPLDSIANYSQLNDILAIIEAFNEAKSKLIEARDNTKALIEA
jgi:hypothetical protein